MVLHPVAMPGGCFYSYMCCDHWIFVHLCVCVCVYVCMSGDCPWSTWSGVGSGSVWQRPRPGWLPGEVAYSFSPYVISMFFTWNLHLCYCHVGPWFCLLCSPLHQFHAYLFTCLSSRVKVDLDIVNKARVVDDVSHIFCFQPFLMLWIQCFTTASTTIQSSCVLCHSGKIFGKGDMALLAYDLECLTWLHVNCSDMLSSAT